MADTCCTCDGVGDLAALLDASGDPPYYTRDELGRTLSVKNPLEETARFGYDENGNQPSLLAPGAEAACDVYHARDCRTVLRTIALAVGATTSCAPDAEVKS